MFYESRCQVSFVIRVRYIWNLRCQFWNNIEWILDVFSEVLVNWESWSFTFLEKFTLTIVMTIKVTLAAAFEEDHATSSTDDFTFTILEGS